MTSPMTYDEFIAAKADVVVPDDHGLDTSHLHPSLFPHQRDAIKWAADRGRGLIAMSFGIGKTRIQCELARLVHERDGGRFLVVCPLGVKPQFQSEDGPVMGQTWEYVRTDEELRAATSPYVITNYERVRDGDIDPRRHQLSGVSLDEGSVLRNLGSKTYQVFEDVFASTPYRFVCTATPSPNEYRELLYYAQFLGVMDHGQGITRWFKRTTSGAGSAGNLQLYPQHEEKFWLWVSTWALFLFSPSDLGYDDAGYALPDLRIHWHRIPVDHRRAFERTDHRGQHKLLLDATGSISEAAQEKRATLSQRIAAMQDIMAANPDRHWLLWHHLEDERRAVERAVPEALAVYGALDIETKEQRILDFTHGRIPILASKPELSGFGCNFQYHCHSNIFLGLDYKFEDFIQAIHRTYRFQQPHPVDVWIIYAESEDHVVEILKAKWSRHNKLTERMRAIVRQYKLSMAAIQSDMRRKLGVTRVEVAGQLFTAVNNDCVRELPGLPDNSVGLVHSSIPFGNHYEYTCSYEDFGHNSTDDAFWAQMKFLIPELLRVLMPGHLCAIHVKDRVLYGHQTASGFMEISEFSDDCVKAFKRAGFLYEGRRTIVTDVVRENNGTYRLGWSEMCNDSTKMGCGLPEYLLLFRKPPTSTATARADVPVRHDKAAYSRGRWQIDAAAFWRSNGNSMIPTALYNYDEHVARLEHMEQVGTLPATFFVEPPVSTSDWVWDDIVFMRCLNARQAQRRMEQHICPLPFDIVERVIRLYSNEGDLVLDPFSGLGTVGYCAIRMGRRAYLVELSETYFDDGVRYCQDAERAALAPTLFDWAAAQSQQPQPAEIPAR